MRALTENTTLSESELAVLQQAKEQILESHPDAELILFGSRARGDAEADSDYDVAMITPEPLHWREEHAVIDLCFEILLETDIDISIRFFSRERWEYYVSMPLIVEIKKDGIPL